MWRPAPRREELLRQALQVHCFFMPGHQYLVHEGEIVLLDEFTGRMTPGRTLTAGLHQAIEAKEQVAIKFMKRPLSHNIGTMVTRELQVSQVFFFFFFA